MLPSKEEQLQIWQKFPKKGLMKGRRKAFDGKAGRVPEVIEGDSPKNKYDIPSQARDLGAMLGIPYTLSKKILTAWYQHLRDTLITYLRRIDMQGFGVVSVAMRYVHETGYTHPVYKLHNNPIAAKHLRECWKEGLMPTNEKEFALAQIEWDMQSHPYPLIERVITDRETEIIKKAISMHSKRVMGHNSILTKYYAENDVKHIDLDEMERIFTKYEIEILKEGDEYAMYKSFTPGKPALGRGATAWEALLLGIRNPEFTNNNAPRNKRNWRKTKQRIQNEDRERQRQLAAKRAERARKKLLKYLESDSL